LFKSAANVISYLDLIQINIIFFKLRDYGRDNHGRYGEITENPGKNCWRADEKKNIKSVATLSAL